MCWVDSCNFIISKTHASKKGIWKTDLILYNKFLIINILWLYPSTILIVFNITLYQNICIFLFSLSCNRHILPCHTISTVYFHPWRQALSLIFIVITILYNKVYTLLICSMNLIRIKKWNNIYWISRWFVLGFQFLIIIFELFCKIWFWRIY